MTRPHPQLVKTPGVAYVTTRSGLELPVIDVTHPSFALDLSDDQLRAETDRFVADAIRRARMPAVIRKPLFWLVLRKSVLAAGLRNTKTTYLGGLDTYIMKLGPDQLGPWAAPIDRLIARSLPALSMRLRLQDVATQLADALEPALAAAPNRPLHLVNIAGGPGLDSINALILLQARDPLLLRHRVTTIRVLDLDDAGPEFGAKALAALRAPGGPLAGVDATFEHRHYDWTRTTDLDQALADSVAANAVFAVSSEGGLFEYGSDEEIRANLAAVRRAAGRDTAVSGSVTRGDGAAQYLDHPKGFRLVPRSREEFERLASASGWREERVVERPLSRQVLLLPA